MRPGKTLFRKFLENALILKAASRGEIAAYLLGGLAVSGILFAPQLAKVAAALLLVAVGLIWVISLRRW